MVIFGSVCSGIEAASVAWEPLGFEAAWLSEIEKFPSAVLAHHWPEVTNLGDMTLLPEKVLAEEIEAPDVLVGGTPCQAFSVAGLRKGLTDERGQLTIKFVELANAIDNVRLNAGKPESIIVWENVPGVLSSKDNAFGCFLAGLCGEVNELQPTGKRWANAGCVYGPQRAIAWRVLDAQYFGVAQRRRRVFVVASARNGFDPTAVLFEFDGLRRDSAPSREPGQSITHDVAPSLTASGRGVERTGESRGQDPVVAHAYRMAAFGEYADDGTASTMKARDYKDATDLAVYPIHDKATRHTGDKRAVGCIGGQHPNAATGIDICPTITQAAGAGGGHVPLVNSMQVRRLTPTECARLQGFPDDHCRIPWRGKPADLCPDGPQYKAYGNSMAVPVMHWIGKRIQQEL